MELQLRQSQVSDRQNDVYVLDGTNKHGPAHIERRFTSIADNHTDLLQLSKTALKTIKNPIKLTFEDVKFEVTIPLNKKDAQSQGVKTVKQQIIKGVSGYALPGQTCYIMGSSGAGKTSLLNIISDRASVKTGTTLSGKIMINDQIPMS